LEQVSLVNSEATVIFCAGGGIAGRSEWGLDDEFAGGVTDKSERGFGDDEPLNIAHMRARIFAAYMLDSSNTHQCLPNMHKTDSHRHESRPVVWDEGFCVWEEGFCDDGHGDAENNLTRKGEICSSKKMKICASRTTPWPDCELHRRLRQAF